MESSLGNEGNPVVVLEFCDFDANFFHEVWSTTDHAALIENAEKHGVKLFVVPGVTIEVSLQSLEWSKRDSRIVSTAGIHPYYANEYCTTANMIGILQSLWNDKNCSAVGECGLDYSEGFPDKSVQLPCFDFQVDQAVRLQKPLFLHVREANDDFLEIMSSKGFGPGATDVPSCCVHCFTGTMDELRTYLEWVFFIGLTGHVYSLPKEQLTEILELITLDKLVIETDAPYMGFKGCRKTETSKKTSKFPNVPASLVQIASQIADAGGWSLQTVADRTTANVRRFFRR